MICGIELSLALTSVHLQPEQQSVNVRPNTSTRIAFVENKEFISLKI